MVSYYWAKFGSKWIGWKEVLPDRTLRAIGSRAQKLKVVAPHKGPKPSKWKLKGSAKGDARHHKTDFELEADPHEDQVMRMLELGMTPHEIDRTMKWYSSTTRKIMVARWKREKEEKHGDTD